MSEDSHTARLIQQYDTEDARDVIGDERCDQRIQELLDESGAATLAELEWGDGDE